MFSCNTNPSLPLNANSTQPVTAKNGRIIFVDVRTNEEWNNEGHANCSINIPLDKLDTKLDTLKTFGKIVFVCRSGKRAGIAKEKLEKTGFINIDNKGAWQNLSCK